MRPKPGKLDKKHPQATRDTLDDIKDLSGDPRPLSNDIRYSNQNRDRALGEADRTGRHFDGEVEAEGEAKLAKASDQHEAD